MASSTRAELRMLDSLWEIRRVLLGERGSSRVAPPFALAHVLVILSWRGMGWDGSCHLGGYVIRHVLRGARAHGSVVGGPKAASCSRRTFGRAWEQRFAWTPVDDDNGRCQDEWPCSLSLGYPNVASRDFRLPMHFISFRDGSQSLGIVRSPVLVALYSSSRTGNVSPSPALLLWGTNH